jgi:hypothetical protein
MWAVLAQMWQLWASADLLLGRRAVQVKAARRDRSVQRRTHELVSAAAKAEAQYEESIRFL